MNAYNQIFFTIFCGVSVFVFGQIIIKFIIEPIHEFKILLREISDDLIYYSNIYCNCLGSGELLNTVEEKFRLNASKLRSYGNAIIFYKINSFIFKLPNKDNINIAFSKLIFISNSIIHNPNPIKNSEAAEVIKSSLGFPISE